MFLISIVFKRWNGDGGSSDESTMEIDYNFIVGWFWLDEENAEVFAVFLFAGAAPATHQNHHFRTGTGKEI